jgi:hypothetical protein
MLSISNKTLHLLTQINEVIQYAKTKPEKTDHFGKIVGALRQV